MRISNGILFLIISLYSVNLYVSDERSGALSAFSASLFNNSEKISEMQRNFETNLVRYGDGEDSLDQKILTLRYFFIEDKLLVTDEKEFDTRNIQAVADTQSLKCTSRGLGNGLQEYSNYRDLAQYFHSAKFIVDFQNKMVAGKAWYTHDDLRKKKVEEQEIEGRNSAFQEELDSFRTIVSQEAQDRKVIRKA